MESKDGFILREESLSVMVDIDTLVQWMAVFHLGVCKRECVELKCICSPFTEDQTIHMTEVGY